MARSTPHVVSGQQVAAASPREVGAPAENEVPSEQSPGLLALWANAQSTAYINSGKWFVRTLPSLFDNQRSKAK